VYCVVGARGPAASDPQHNLYTALTGLLIAHFVGQASSLAIARLVECVTNWPNQVWIPVIFTFFALINCVTRVVTFICGVHPEGSSAILPPLEVTVG
jgi:hypothetical protein